MLQGKSRADFWVTYANYYFKIVRSKYVYFLPHSEKYLAQIRLVVFNKNARFSSEK